MLQPSVALKSSLRIVSCNITFREKVLPKKFNVVERNPCSHPDVIWIGYLHAVIIWTETRSLSQSTWFYHYFFLLYYYMKNYCNRPFPSSKNSHFQNEAKCETFVVKMSFICIIIKNHFHINGFALSLALKVRFFGTRKWPILGPRLYTAVTKHAPSLTSTKLQVWTEEKTLLFSVEATSVNSRRLQW